MGKFYKQIYDILNTFENHLCLSIHETTVFFMMSGYVRKINNLLEEFRYRLFETRGKKIKKIKEREYKEFIDSIEDLKTSIRQYDIISFDIFDTALLRKIKRYDYAREAKEVELATRMGLDEHAFQGLWSEALQQCMTENPDFTQDCLYEKILRASGYKNLKKEDILNTELDVEQKLLYRNPLIYPVYKLAKSLGKHIIFISDMYLESRYLEKLLVQNGYSDFRLYVSAGTDMSKQRGDLFRYVIEQEKADPAKILHIGDNFKGDITNAKKQGIHTFFYDKRKLQCSIFDIEKPAWPKLSYNLNEKLFVGLARKFNLDTSIDEHFNSTIFKLGYEVIGPAHLSYVFWLIKRAREKGITRLYFLSRDGYYLQKWFEKINMIRPTGLTGHYTYASRRLYTLPYITQLDEQALETLTKADQEITVRDLLHRLEINCDDVKKELANAGYTNPEEKLTNFRGQYIQKEKRTQLKHFFKLIETRVLQSAERERNNLEDYYHHIGLDSKQSAMVDVGWNASSLYYINNILRSAKQDLPAGFYFGTWQQAAGSIREGFDLESFFIHLGQPRIRRKILEGNIALLEMFFTAPHPTIIGIENNHGWKPVYDPVPYDQEDSTIIESLYSGAEQFVDDALALPGLTCDPCLNYLLVTLHKLACHPEYEWARELGKFKHKISFGSIRELMPIAPEPGSAMDENDIRKLKQYSLWKHGTNALLNK